MDWLQIGSAALMVGMLVFIFPRVRHAMKNSPKGTSQDWMGFIIPLAAVIGFVILLIMSVRN
jgi:hypothetical protein